MTEASAPSGAGAVASPFSPEEKTRREAKQWAQTVNKKFAKKTKTPVLGEAFGSGWGSDVSSIYRMPGGGAVSFDLSQLTDSDFRMMQDHYQVSSSLMTLTFMMHQCTWTIECDNEKIRKFIHEMIEQLWPQLVRTLSTAFWAGRAPAILQWENDVAGKRVGVTKVKDLVPENVIINWKKVDGHSSPGKVSQKIHLYDGLIDRWGGEVPAENSLWYSLLMREGDYNGRKLLKPAFTAWYFSILMHLFANGYFERFGQPTPVGRAPWDESVQVGEEDVPARQVMFDMITSLRNRSVVVLPNDRTPDGDDYEYTISYLESQMRGADFERYINRLDEEISLALFTPVLMTRTADVGSYSLGETHSKTYARILNALGADWAEYINRYIIDRAVNVNFGINAPRARFKFRRVGDDRLDMLKVILQQVMSEGSTKLDLKQVSEIIGITVEEREELTKPAPKPNTDPTADPNADPIRDPSISDEKLKASASRLILHARTVPEWQIAAEYTALAKLAGISQSKIDFNLGVYELTRKQTDSIEALVPSLIAR